MLLGDKLLSGIPKPSWSIQGLYIYVVFLYYMMFFNILKHSGPLKEFLGLAFYYLTKPSWLLIYSTVRSTECPQIYFLTIIAQIDCSALPDVYHLKFCCSLSWKITVHLFFLERDANRFDFSWSGCYVQIPIIVLQLV